MFWRHLWKLKLPPKVKALMWRASSNCLPTMDRLISRRVDVNPLCPVCGTSEESVLHALVTCQKSTQVWDRVGIGTPSRSPQSFFQWITDCFQHHDGERQSFISTVCWALWSARNNFVWNKKHTPTVAILKTATDFLNQWRDA